MTITLVRDEVGSIQSLIFLSPRTKNIDLEDVAHGEFWLGRWCWGLLSHGRGWKVLLLHDIFGVRDRNLLRYLVGVVVRCTVRGEAIRLLLVTVEWLVATGSEFLAVGTAKLTTTVGVTLTAVAAGSGKWGLVVLVCDSLSKLSEIKAVCGKAKRLVWVLTLYSGLLSLTFDFDQG